MRKKININNYKAMKNEYEEYLGHVLKEAQNKLDQMFNEEATDDVDYSKYTISVVIGDTEYELGCCAAEWNGLLDYLKYIISQQ